MNEPESGWQRLAQVLDDYMAACAAGNEPDVETLAAENPSLADELRTCLASLKFVGAAAEKAQSPSLVIDEPQGDQRPAHRLGDFELLREIGRGGMGVVYEARQISLERRVALKVLPFADVLDPRQLQRFKNEALAAAQLDHPHIVEVIAVGCERGVNYYAMRFVDGPTLAEVIEKLRIADCQGSKEKGESNAQRRRSDTNPQRKQGRALRIAESRCETSPPRSQVPIRNPQSPTLPIAGLSTSGGAGSLAAGRAFYRAVAELGIAAAEGLEHAHQHGIVHRDVKPGNLMLDQRGKLWITDFGLAQIESAASLTTPGDLLGTLRYMSPEQALAKRVTIDYRTDIYSLGATLYELATLQPVFDGRDKQELLRQLSFEEPRPLRKVRRGVPAEIETIVLKALEKDPADRYQAAQELADDLRRYLADEPIQARRLSARQRAARWTQRHVGLVFSMGAALIVALTVSVVAGLVVYRSNQAKDEALDTAEQQRKLAIERQLEADERLEIAKQAVDEYLNRITEDPDLKRSDFNNLRKKLLESAVPFFQRLAEQKPGDATAEAERGRAYQRLASLRNGIGEKAESLADWERSRTIFDRLAGDFPSRPKYREEMATSQSNVSKLLWPLGRHDEAETACRAALAVQERLVADFPDAPQYRVALSTSYSVLAGFLGELGRQRERESLYRAVLAIRQKLADDFPSDPQYRDRLASSQHSLGSLFLVTGRVEDAEAAYRKSVALWEELAGELHDTAQYRQHLANSQNSLGCVLIDVGKHIDAEACYRSALSIQEKLAAGFPSVVEYREAPPRSNHNLGRLLYRLGRYGEAEAAYRAALAGRQKLSADFPDVPGYPQGVAMIANSLALLLVDLGRRDEAEPLYRWALAIQEKLAADFPNVVAYRLELAVSRHNLGVLLGLLHKPDDALAEHRAALAVEEKLAEDLRNEPQVTVELAKTRSDLGSLLFDLRRDGEAEAEFRAASAIQEKLAADFPAQPEHRRELAKTSSNLGVLLAGGGRFDEARSACQSAHVIREQLAANFSDVPQYAVDLGASLCDMGHVLRQSDCAQGSLDWYGRSIQFLNELVAKNARLVMARRFLRDAHWGRARALDDLQRYAEAVADWDRAIEIDDGADRSQLRSSRAASLAHARKDGKVTDSAKQETAGGSPRSAVAESKK